MLKVRVERIAPEGEGLGKAAGSDKVVFVPYGLPGDLVEVEPTEEKARYTRGRLVGVLESSPSRVAPRCPIHFLPGKKEYCGGCDWQHAAYEAQLKLKRDVVLDCLRRIAKLDVPVLDTLASPQPWRYRNKVQVPFQASDRGFKAGFFVPGSHRVIEFDDCEVQSKLSVAIVTTVKELARTHGWRAYDERQDRGWLRHLYLRTNSAGEAAVVFVTRERPFPKEREAVAELTKRHPQIVSVWQNVQEEKSSVILGPRWRKISGRDRLSEKIGPLTLEFSPGAFIQVNTPAAEVLYHAVATLFFEGDFKPRLALDVYSGVGAIALWIASGAERDSMRERAQLARGVGLGPTRSRGESAIGACRFIGIEESPQAVEDAYGNARRMGLRNVSFVQGSAQHALRRLQGLDSPRPWGAVLDPPRAGCDPGTLKFLSSRRVDRIVYVSCDPATFTRDARLLADSGYRLEKIQPVDLFPQTSHVELAAKFTLA